MQRKPFEGALEEHPTLGQAARHVPAPPGLTVEPCFRQIVLSQIQSLLPLMAAVAGLW